MHLVIRVLLLFAWLTLLSAGSNVHLLASGTIEFNRDIRPILSEYCFACHGPDANHREADLRFDVRDSAINAHAIVPGDIAASVLIERIKSSDLETVMPPTHTGKTLTDSQKVLLENWIADGATYQNHWSFEPIPKRIPLSQEQIDWGYNSIDPYVALKWADKGLRANEEATKATWLRRVTFDLTGLPPTIDEIASFEEDQSADAYEKVVDRLLTSSAYGERMANMWLDVARYADTFGYQSDVAMEVWPWRDWVINAFNDNMPYNEFVRQQLAGDLLPNATQDQRLATAFNRLHRQTNEGGSIAEEFRIAGIADRTTTMGTAFLGLTLECARCHDHKFDPILQREFYQLSAYFSNIDELGLYSHFTFSAPTPALKLYTGSQQTNHAAAVQMVQEAKMDYEAQTTSAYAYWDAHREELIQTLPEPRPQVATMELEGESAGVVGNATRFDGDNQLVCDTAPEFGRESPFSYSIWVNPAALQERSIILHQSVAAEDSGFRGIQLTLDNGYPEFSMIHFWPGNAVRIRADAAIPTNDWTHLAITHDGSGTAEGITLFVNGYRAPVATIRNELTRDVRHRGEWGDMNVGSVKLALGARFRDIGFRNGMMDDLRVYDCTLTAAEVLSIYATAKSLSIDELPLELSLEYQVKMRDEAVDLALQALLHAYAAENNLVTSIREIMTMAESKYARPTHILNRGEYTSPADTVAPLTPRAIGFNQLDGGSRLDFANWLTDPDHPLTARVIANRYWHLFFGRGIVTTLEDLGSQGAPPTHPELLDHLARYLIDNDWDLQKLSKLIVLSATYRQSSDVPDAASINIDPENVWLSRGPKHRLSAEQLRDSVLAASGLLVNKVGGPSVMPYQPAGLWEEAGTGKSYNQSTGEGLYRRSLYTFWKRTSPPPSMLTFDATSRESCTARRELTTTPLQALVLLNDPQFVEAAKVLASQLLSKHPDDLDAAWHELFMRLLSRPPNDEELLIIHTLYDEQLEYFMADNSNPNALLGVGEHVIDMEVDAAQLAAVTIVVQTVFAYDETVMLR